MTPFWRTAALLHAGLILPLAFASAQRIQTQQGSSQSFVLATYDVSASLEMRRGWSGLTPVFNVRLISFDGVQLFDGTRVRASEMPADLRQRAVTLRQSPGSELRITYGVYDNGTLVKESTSNAAGTGSKPAWTAIVGSTEGWPGLHPAERAANKGKKMFADGRFSIRIHKIEYAGQWNLQLVREWLKTRSR